MSVQSSVARRKPIRRSERREETTQQRALSQLLQRLGSTRPSPQSPFQEPSMREAFPRSFPHGASPKSIIENLLLHGTIGQLESSSPSSSILHQPNLQMILRQAQRRLQAEIEQRIQAQAEQRTETPQQSYPAEKKSIMSAPVQTNSRSPGISQQSHAEQPLLQPPLQQPKQMLPLVNPGNPNTQMSVQAPQLQVDSSWGTSMVSQQSHIQKDESLNRRQTSQHSMETLRHQNPQGMPLFTEPFHYRNQCTPQSSDGSLQQNIQGLQQLLLKLSQQVPVLSLQQSLQAQPLLLQVLPSSSAPLQQLCSKLNQHPVLPVAQQSIPLQVDRMPVQFSLQGAQPFPPLQQSAPLQQSQQPDQATPSIALKIPREAPHGVQQVQPNQSSISSELSIFQRIQQMFQQTLSQQQVPKWMRTDFGITSLLAQLTQTTQQQSNLQQLAQESRAQSVQQFPFAHFIPREAMGSESRVQSSQHSSQAIHHSFQIPDVSLLDLPQGDFVRVIRQHPYKVPLSRRNSMKSTSGTVRSREVSFKSLRHHQSTTKFAQKSILESGPESSAQTLSTQLSQQSSVLQGNQTQELLRGNSAFTGDNNTSQIPGDDELRRTFLDDNPEDDETTFVEVGTEDLVSNTETNTSSTASRRSLKTALSWSTDEMDRRSLETALSWSTDEMDRRSLERALSGSGNLQEPDEAMIGKGPDSLSIEIFEDTNQ